MEHTCTGDPFAVNGWGRNSYSLLSLGVTAVSLSFHVFSFVGSCDRPRSIHRASCISNPFVFRISISFRSFQISLLPERQPYGFGLMASAYRLNFSHRKSTKGGWEGAV